MLYADQLAIARGHHVFSYYHSPVCVRIDRCGARQRIVMTIFGNDLNWTAGEIVSCGCRYVLVCRVVAVYSGCGGDQTGREVVYHRLSLLNASAEGSIRLDHVKVI